MLTRNAARLRCSRTRAVFDLVALTSLILIAVAVVMVLPVERWLPTTGQSQFAPLDRFNSSCTMELTTTLKPDPQSICDPVDVTTTFSAACPACPNGLNVVFIQDDTPYPEWQKRVSLQALAELERYARGGRSVSVGVLHYNGQGVRTALRPTKYLGAARGPLTSFRVAHDPRAQFMQAAQRGVAMIREGRRLHQGGTDPDCEFVIFFVYTKVYMEDKGQEMIQAGRTIMRVVPNLFVGCPHQHPEECTIWEPQVPKSLRYYTEDPEPSKLRGMVMQGLREIDDKGQVRMISMSTEQMLPRGLKPLPGTFNVDPDKTETEGDTTRLTWDWRGPKITDPVTLTFQAWPKLPGNWQSEVANTWRDSVNEMGERRVNSEPMTVYHDLCYTPTPTVPAPPTPTPSVTPPPTETEEPTETPPATNTPPPTATQRPAPIYLPVLLGEKCVPGEAHADVVLVIDVSTSMLRLSRTGRTKLAATQDAAKHFVALMQLTPGDSGGHDQLGVVGFNKAAWIQAPLGATTDQLTSAIDDLAMHTAEHTRLDLALDVGAQTILEGSRVPGNTPVIILLTDGLPNMVPYAEDGTVETTVLRSAEAAKNEGIAVFTIAIGEPDDTNPELLSACATAPENYYYTPDPEDLASIYQAIAHTIGCPPSVFWGRR